MATQSTTIQSALQVLGLDPADNENTNNYTAAGVTPASLLAHTVKKDYVILGTTPQEFMDRHGSAAFDFNAIRAHFSLICEDFEAQLALETPSKAVEFCSKMIYEVGPEARQVRKKDGDKTWRFMFVYKKNNKLQTKVAFVSTYKTDESSYKVEMEPTKITLSVKTASLLAVIILNKLNGISMNMNPPVILLSPLAGSVFSKDDIPKIAEELNAQVYKIVCVINASCQSGGHYLDDSRLHCAAVASIVATRNVKDPKMKDAIVGKTIKQYLNVKKEFKTTFYEAYAEFGHGGVPSVLSPNNLIKLFEDIQKITPMQAARAAKQTENKTQVVVPAAMAPKIKTKPDQLSEGLEAASSSKSGKGKNKAARPPTPSES